jgi:hypothetical protein
MIFLNSDIKKKSLKFTIKKNKSLISHIDIYIYIIFFVERERVRDPQHIIPEMR